MLADPATHDAWFRARVREALEGERPDLDGAEVEALFEARRAATLGKLGDR